VTRVHPADLRAQVVAAVLAGTALSQVARQYGLSKGTIGNWLAQERGTFGTDQRARLDLGELILGLIERHVQTLEAQLQAAARPEWLEKQSAAELAELVVAERDTTLRLLAGLRPVDDGAGQPQLDSPGASANA